MNRATWCIPLEEKDVVVLGAGLSGLAAGVRLGDRAVLLERDARPGGLVRTTCFNGYWFDHVVHLLHFYDEPTERYVRALLGPDLAACPSEAWVETPVGTVRYPFQVHLAGFGPDIANRCVEDFATALAASPDQPPGNFEDHLLATFGQGMCDLFLFPYNRKLWKRPLHTLAPAGFQWTIAHPDFEQVSRGARAASSGFAPYNARGWYPRPPQDSPVRGMELLTRALAAQCADLRVNHRVEEIDLEARTVVVRHGDNRRMFRYRDACAATLPLPELLAICKQTPDALRAASRRLVRNRVLTIALGVRGPRPATLGHWRYYSDPSLIFNRLVFMHEFDPGTAPPDGWGILVEITEPAEAPLCPTDDLLRRVQADVRRVVPFPPDAAIVEAHVMCIDPAYVVFTLDTADVVERALQFLRAYGVEPLGRYGRWEYSSMSQAIRHAFQWADAMNQAAC